MVKLIQDLWILSNSGIVVFSRAFDQKVDEQLFGGLMSALDTFAQVLSDDGLTNFELSAIRFTLLKDNNFLFVANSSKKHKERKIQEQLKTISKKFFKKYKDVLENWDYEVGVFGDFENEIAEELEDPMKKFWDGF